MIDSNFGDLMGKDIGKKKNSGKKGVLKVGIRGVQNAVSTYHCF